MDVSSHRFIEHHTLLARSPDQPRPPTMPVEVAGDLEPILTRLKPTAIHDQLDTLLDQAEGICRLPSSRAFARAKPPGAMLMTDGYEVTTKWPRRAGSCI